MTNGPKRQGQGAETWRTQSYLIGHPLAQQDRYDEALAIYQAVIQREPEDILAHLLAARALLNLERDAEAHTYFERALALAEQALQRDAGDQRARVFFADALWPTPKRMSTKDTRCSCSADMPKRRPSSSRR
jgi:tetratricopeptide (TPR) repeat protein